MPSEQDFTITLSQISAMIVHRKSLAQLAFRQQARARRIVAGQNAGDAMVSSAGGG